MIAKFMGNALSTALLAAIIAMPMQAKADDDSRFDSPIVGSAVGTTIAGIGSAGAAWVVKRGRARLESDGALKIEVTGLLLAATGTTGTVQAVAASVACGDMVGLGASTDPVPLPATGSFEIRAMVTLPQPACQGAVVLIRIVRANTPIGAFIASTGVTD